MQRYTSPPGEGWRPVTQRLVLRGPPPLLRGELTLVNESEEKVRVRTLAVREASAKGVRGVKGVTSLRIGTRIAPHDTSHVRASLAIDPHTPPGEYTIDAEGFGEGEVVLEVFERLSVQLDPSRLELRGAPGEVVEADVHATNRGNVPVTVPRAALVHLEERFWLGRSMVYVLREIDRDAGAHAFFDRLLAEFKDTDIRPMRVEVEGAGESLAPGESVTLTLRLHLPEELRKGRDYVRSIEFMHARLFVAVNCDGSAPSTKRRAR